MKSTYIFLAVVTMLSVPTQAREADQEVSTVENIVLADYLGKWHQIATIPAWFQRSCAKNTTAEYSRDPNEDKLIKVVNGCDKENGEHVSSTGAARINPKYNSPSKLQVSFVNIFGSWVWVFGGNYWIMSVGTDGKTSTYSYSIIGEPKRNYLWILSRSPTISRDELVKLRDIVAKNGYNLSKIIITQEGPLKGQTLNDLAK